MTTTEIRDRIVLTSRKIESLDDMCVSEGILDAYNLPKYEVG